MVSILMHSGDKAREYILNVGLVDDLLELDKNITEEKLIIEAVRLSEDDRTTVVYWLGIFKARKMQGLCYPWEDK